MRILSTKLSLLILCCTCLIVSGIFGFHYYHNIQDLSSDTHVEHIENNNDKVDYEFDDIDTSDWKAYRNEKYGWEIKYPSDWKEIGGVAESISFTSKNINETYAPSISVEKSGNNPERLSVDKWEEEKGWVRKEVHQILSGGITSTGLSKEEVKNRKYRSFALLHFTYNGYMFTISWYDNMRSAPDAYRIFLEMIQTFRFTR